MCASKVEIGHVWVVVRVDRSTVSADTTAELADCIAVKEVHWDEARAAAEVLRLNRLNGSKGAFYFYRVARFRQQPPEEIPDHDA